MEERPSEPNASVDSSAPPSVAQLAGRFREQEAASKEMPASKPTRRKPPCSLPLFPPRVELGQNGEEPGRPSPKESKQPRDSPKSPANASHPPKVKVKSSPLIEKLQANLAFAPAALLPGASPKSPGLKAMVSPFHSPPSTPSSPGVPPSRASESEEVPVSFDQPPEGSHLPCYNKVRTRGSIKRRPPSRRFRRSQSDSGELGGFRAPESSQENGAQEENEDEVFPSKSKASGSPPPSEGEVGREGRKTLGSHEKPPLRRTASRTEKREQQGQAPEDGGPQPTWAAREAPGTATEPAPASGTEAKNGRGSPTEESPAGERTEEAARVEEEKAGDGEEVPGQKSQDKKPLPEEGAEGQETPQACPGAAEAGPAPEEAKGKEKQDKGPILEPSCKPRTGQAPAETSSEVPETEEDDTSVQDTKM